MKKASLLLGGILGAASLLARTPGEKPNIVFILADDMGYGDVSALNAEGKIDTPHIDRMVERGATFTDAHSSSAVSTPTRYGILTGRYNWRSDLKSGVLYGYDKALIAPDRTTLPGMLKESGYTTGCIGKWHLGWTWNNIEQGPENVDFSEPITDGPTSRGFDYFFGISASLDMPPYVYVENDRSTSIPDRITRDTDMRFWREGPTGSDFSHEACLPVLTRETVEFIDRHAGDDNPFFLYFPLPAPHTPILPVKEFQGKSGLNSYADFVLMVDWVVGQVTETLEKNGILENTILIFTSDNGCSTTARFEELHTKGHYPNYIFRGHKADLFDGGHRIPCIVQWPARVAPHRIDQTVCLTDFMATFAALTDRKLADNEGEDSYDMLPLLLADHDPETIREATVHHSINGSFTIRQGEWKLLLAPDSGGWSYPRPGRDSTEGWPAVQLYNLKSDPGEQRNVYAEHPETVRKLTDLMISYIRNGRSTPGEPQPNDNSGNWPQLDRFMK